MWQYREAGNLFTDTVTDEENQALFFLGTTLVTPLGWYAAGTRGAVAASKLWKLRQLLFGLPLISSGGGGPGESSTSTDVNLTSSAAGPPGLHQQGQPLSVVVPAASISAHGGRRSGAKARSRKRCPPGYRWNGRRCVRKG